MTRTHWPLGVLGVALAVTTAVLLAARSEPARHEPMSQGESRGYAGGTLPRNGVERPSSREWHVGAGAMGDGSAGRPFGSISEALAHANAGDTILISPGTYKASLRTVRGGTPGAPLTLRAARPDDRPVFEVAGRVATIGHPHVVLDGLVLDGVYGEDDAVRVTSDASGLVLRNLEVRRSSRDCVDMAAPTDVLIEGALVHHCLDSRQGRTDAHGIVAGPVRGLTIRDTEIHTFSGDAIQLDPGRRAPGWTDVLIERSRFWLAPLETTVNGFPAGVVPGENAVDTKTPHAGLRATLVVRDVEAHGFRNGLITNMAAFNIKERVDALLDGVTVRDSEIAFRVRGPSDKGAAVTLRNAVVHHVGTMVRYEGDIAPLRVHHATAGRAVGRVFRAAAATVLPEVRNLLVLGTTLPREAVGHGLAVGPLSFVDVEADDYRLRAGSAARDAAEPVEGVSVDRHGVIRPQGARPDVGAHEWCATCTADRRPVSPASRRRPGL